MTRVLRAVAVDLGGEHRVRLEIGVAGVLQDFRVRLEVFRDGAAVVPAPAAFACECTMEELSARIDQAVVAAIPMLKGESAAAKPRVPEATPEPRVEGSAPQEPSPDQKVPLGGLGKAGIGVLVFGAVAVIAGGVLVGVESRDARGDLEGTGETTNLRRPGFGVLAVGLGGVVVAAVLLSIDRARARRQRSHSGGSVGRHFAGFSGIVRF